jgi:hypothetical protein
MPNEDATPVIFFVVSLYGFGIVLLYVLARAWEQALSTRPATDKTSKSTTEISSSEPAGTKCGRAETLSAKVGTGDTDG